MPRGRKSNVVVVNQIERLLQEMVVAHFDLRFDAIEKSLIPRVDRLESRLDSVEHEHGSQIRELYSRCAAIEARLGNVEKKIS